MKLNVKNTLPGACGKILTNNFFFFSNNILLSLCITHALKLTYALHYNIINFTFKTLSIFNKSHLKRYLYATQHIILI